MSDIDWSEAPDGATHHAAGDRNPWEMHVGDKLYFLGSKKEWLPMTLSIKNMERGNVIPRPTAWNGTTLPPVGTVCEYKPILDDDWITVKITGYGERLALIKPHGKDYETICSKSSATFRPTKTERERAIDEISAAYFEGARGHMGGIAGIYEAGFRKVQ